MAAKRKTSCDGFTRIDLIFAAGAMILAAVVAMPVLAGSTRGKSEAIQCIANLRRLAICVEYFTTENDGLFPAHRNQGTDRSNVILTNWWGTTLWQYGTIDTNTFRCPVLKTAQQLELRTWQWRFDPHLVGYGYNAYFLGQHPYAGGTLTLGGIRFSTTSTFWRGEVVNPAMTLLLADSRPTPNMEWSSALWWPSACMNPRTSSTRGYEGVATDRHESLGTVAFVDGHVESRRDAQINPPYDPSSGNPRALENAQFWDPLQRTVQN
jgi:prepilin-type processing-associated H-X9-DG protein